MLIIASFKESIVWGLAVLFVPFAALVFLIMHWTEAKKAFLVQLVAVLCCLGAISIAVAKGIKPALSKIPQAPGRAVSTSERQESLSFFKHLKMRRSPDDRAALVGDPAALLGLKGKTLKESRKLLGRPKGRLATDGQAVLIYPECTLVSDDGKTVAWVELTKNAGRPVRKQVTETGSSMSAVQKNIARDKQSR